MLMRQKDRLVRLPTLKVSGTYDHGGCYVATIMSEIECG